MSLLYQPLFPQPQPTRFLPLPRALTPQHPHTLTFLTLVSFGTSVFFTLLVTSSLARSALSAALHQSFLLASALILALHAVQLKLIMNPFLTPGQIANLAILLPA